MQEVFENIIKKLEEKAKYHMDFSKIEKIRKEIRIGHLEQYQCFITAIEIVKQEAAEYNNGWIPCSERLPEEYGEYLVWWTDITEKQYYEITEYEPNDGWIGDIPQAYQGKYSVIAWQPLPNPYQPKGE